MSKMHQAFKNLMKSGRLDKGLWWQFGPTVVDGCTPVSEGCRNCWSASNHHHWQRGLTDERGRWKGEISLHLDRLERVARRKKPAVISIWNDLFHEKVAPGFMSKVFQVIHNSPRHLFIVLTKRPGRALIYGKSYSIRGESVWPQNLILGTTVEDQPTADERLPILMQIPAWARFISYEPALGPIKIWDALEINRLKDTGEWVRSGWKPVFDWVVAGCESRGSYPRRPADLDWFRDLRDRCAFAGVPFFLKQAEIEKGKLSKAPFLDCHQHLELPHLKAA